MPEALVQTAAAGKLTTPFGADVLALVSMSASEGLSELFEIRVSAISLTGNLDFNTALGVGSTIQLTTLDNQNRYFNGLMTEARWAGVREDIYSYEFVLRPWLWFLTRTSDCRIFPNMNALQIIKQVFSDRGFSNFRDATTNTPPTLEYTVQYRETDFNFVCRLMEEYGIYYFFEHTDGLHTLVLADAKASHTAVPGLSSLQFLPVDRAGRGDKQYVESWSVGRRAQSGKFTLNDYDYNKPPTQLLADTEKPGGYSHDSMEMYDYPGGYNVMSDGTDLSKYQAEAAQSLDLRRSSSGAAPSLFPGGLITTTAIDTASENQEYLITHCSHYIEARDYRSGGAGGRNYSGQYEMTPSDKQYRAPQATVKPEIAGVQSALVIGAEGEEIDTDSLGRVLVQFYWDRKKKPSRRVRVAQIWAGQTRGALFLPRIGDEVMIAYEDGDPDRPLVVGSVYNGTNTVPMSLPSKQVKSGILTKSSKGGGGYHMLVFDDTAGSEVVKLRSQKDLMVKALHDETRWIGNDHKETIIGNETREVDGNQTETVKGNVSKTVNGNESETIDGNDTNQVNRSYSLTAVQKITLTVGGSSITMDPESITIESPTIKVNGDTLVTISAPMVKINS